MPNRLITDNALIAFECFNFTKHKEKERHGFMGLKLNMSGQGGMDFSGADSFF